MASIQRRTTKAGVETWRVGYREGGRLHWTPTLASGQGAVEVKMLIERHGPAVALAAIQARSGRDVTTGAPLLSDYLAVHLAHLEADCTPGTIADYRRMAERTWLPTLGVRPLDAITRETVEAWVAWQRRQPAQRLARDADGAPIERTYASKSIRNAHGLLSAVLSRAVEDRNVPTVTENVAYRTRLPADQVDAERDTFTPDEWVRFIGAMQEHYRPLTRFLLATGARWGEATALQVRDVELTATGAVVRIRRAWKKDEAGVYLGAPKSKRSIRSVVVGGDVAADLDASCAGRAADALVFPSAQGHRVQAQHYRERAWSRALAAAGIDKRLTPHSLRHTSATWLLMAGQSPLVVQRRLGHESLATTSKVYAHLLTDEQIGAAAMLDVATRGIEG